MELQHLFVCLFAFISSSLSYQLRHLPNPAHHSGAGRSQPSRPPPFCALPATPNSLHLFQLRNELPGVHMTRTDGGTGGRGRPWRALSCLAAACAHTFLQGSLRTVSALTAPDLLSSPGAASPHGTEMEATAGPSRCSRLLFCLPPA